MNDLIIFFEGVTRNPQREKKRKNPSLVFLCGFSRWELWASW